MDNQYIRILRIRHKSVGKQLYAAVCLLLVTSLLLTSVSYAWLILSRAPEISGMTSNIGANGNLEIALGKNIGKSAVGDSINKSAVTQANRTWGNLIDLSDESYGLQDIILRPAILNSAGGAVNILHPLAYPMYSTDGRMEKLYANTMYTGSYNGSTFVTGVNEYGVRAIGATTHIASGVDDTFGPLSQRQKTYYDACDQLWGMSQSSYESLCEKYQRVLMAYCYYRTGVSASEFDPIAFSQRIDEFVSAANEELRLCFSLLAAAEITSPASYNSAMTLLEEAYPNYEAVRPMVSSAIQAMGAADVDAAIAELRAFQDAAMQLKVVITSGEIEGSDGYSMEEIARTIGLIFDLDKTNFTVSTVNYNDKPYTYTDNNFYSSVISELYYQIPHHEIRGWLTSQKQYGGSSVSNLTSSLLSSNRYNEYQDNASREDTANSIRSHMHPIYNSLRLADLDQAMASLYASHWSYWDLCKEEYVLLQEQIETLNAQIALLEEQLQRSENKRLEAELQLITAELESKDDQLRALMDAETYSLNDSRLTTIRSVMVDTIEAMRQYTLWSIAYFACDGQIPDDAYHRILEIVKSSEYAHPSTAYQILCNYGIAPSGNLAQMVATYEKLEQDLLFLQSASGSEDTINWSDLSDELDRIIGTITHNFYFGGSNISDSSSSDYVSYSSSYSPEDTSAPTEVMTKIREEIDTYEAAVVGFNYKSTRYYVSYGIYEEDRPWASALGLLNSFYSEAYPFEYGSSAYTLEGLRFSMNHRMYYADGFGFSISIGVGTQDNFNDSGLTVRQTRFQTAQENISTYQAQLISAAVTMDPEMVTLLMQLIAGQSDVSIGTISNYLSSLQQQLDYAENMMYQAALAMAASDYAEDSVYQRVYSDNGYHTASQVIELLRLSAFDENVMAAFDNRMDLLNNQKAMLEYSEGLLRSYQDPNTGAFTTERISAAEAATLLAPVLDMNNMTLYGYIAERPVQSSDSDTLDTPQYVRTVLYAGFGAAPVQIDGNQATVGNSEPVTILGDVYLNLGRSLSGSLLALAKAQVETYTPSTGGVDASDIAQLESGMTRKAYSMVTGGELFTLDLRTEDVPYALPTNLWNYTGNTAYISANNMLVDLYGYCIDLSFRTNATNSDLLLQTEAVNRIDNSDPALVDKSMGAGSYMEFTIDHPSYRITQAKEYMSCVRVVITDTRTGYIYGYAALDMNRVEVVGVTLKAPLRLYDKYTGVLLEGNAAQYICRLDQNLEKNITIYVYLDGAKTSNAFVSASGEQSLHGALNLQFRSSADLIPAGIDVSEKPSEPPSEEPEIPEDPDVPENGTDTILNTGDLTDTITWTLYSNGLLKFDGTGAMPDFSADRDAPWYDNRNSVTKVEISDGITYLGLGNLAATDYAEITIPESVVAIVGHNALGGQYKTVHYAGSIQQWNALAIFDYNNTLVGGTINAEKGNAQVLQSGNIQSTSFSWALSADGILTVYGTGAMPDWTETYEAPWEQFESNIKQLVIADGITYVGSYAFDGLTTLQSVKIAGSVTALGEYAFSECENLLAVAIEENSALREVDQYCFNWCSSLKYINLPDTVINLGYMAFACCGALDHIMIDSVTMMGRYVFYGCESLTSLTLAEGLRIIPDGTFARCFILSKVVIPSTVIEIGSEAFPVEYSDGALAVNYAGSAEQWADISVGYRNDGLDNAVFTFERAIVASGSVNDDITWALDEAGVLIISGTGDMPDYADGVGINDQDIADWIHEDYHTVIISDGITSIGEYAFLWAEDLSTVIIRPNVTSISQNAFEGCSSEITILLNGYEYEFEELVSGSNFSSNITFEYLY